MWCTKCGAELPDNAKFCTVCGAKVVGPQQAPGGGSTSVPASESARGAAPETPSPRTRRGPMIAIAAVCVVALLALAVFVGTQRAGGGAAPAADAPQQGSGSAEDVPAEVAVSEPARDLAISVQQIDASAFPTVRLYLRVEDPATGEVPEGLDGSLFYIEREDANATFVKQTVVTATQLNETESLKVGMVADVSGSMSGAPLDDAKRIMRDFVSSMQFDAGDEVELVSFSTGVRLERELTADEAALSSSISNLATDDMTSLYDALYASVERMAAQDGARCVIAFTDGNDNYSSCTMDDVIEVANRYRVPVFIIGIGSVDASGVQAICDATGGAYYSISSVGSMAELYNSIYRMEKELYLLEFTDSTGASVSDAASIQVGYAGADYAGSCTYSYTPNVLLSAESSTIFSDGPEATVERYLKNFDDAMTYTDFSRISDCLKPGSDIYAEQEAYVTRGISEELDSYEISPASYTDAAHATVATRETFYVQVPGKPLQLMTQECTYALECVGDTWLMTSFVDLEVTNRINQ